MNQVGSRRQHGHFDVRFLFIEHNESLCDRLQTCVGPRSDVEIRNADFSSCLDDVLRATKEHTVFLYLDPFTVEGLDWIALDRVFAKVSAERSIEVLLNLNTMAFFRRAKACLVQQPVSQIELAEEDLDADAGPDAPGAESLDRIAGGDWWRVSAWHDRILNGTASIVVEELTTEFTRRLQSRFEEVCTYPVKERWNDSAPKYELVFGSRHPHALDLMNDAMVKARDQQADAEAPSIPELFETRPTSLVPDKSHLDRHVRAALGDESLKRRDLVHRVIRRHFCIYKESEIKRAVNQLIKAGILKTDSPNAKPNDDTLLWESRETLF